MAETLKLFDQFEAAAMLGVSQSTLRRMRSMGDGPAFVRVATRRIGYSREALADWVQVRTVAPARRSRPDRRIKKPAPFLAAGSESERR